MDRIAKLVCLAVVFLFVFTANFNGILIEPFAPSIAEAKKKHKKHKKHKNDKGKDKDRDKGKDGKVPLLVEIEQCLTPL